MWRTKRIFAAVLCAACLCGCAAEEQNDVDLLNAEISVNYQLTQVTEGTFRKTEKSGANPVNVLVEELLCEYEDAILKENLSAKLGGMVKEGDILATIVQKTSETELKRLELEYERAQDEMDNGIAQHYSRIAAISGSDSIAYMQRVKAENDLALYKMSAQEKCQTALEALEEYKQRYEEKYIVAPFDGMVAWTEALKAGDEIPMGSAVIRVYDPTSVIVKLSNPSESFLKMTAPGSKVTITFLNQSHAGYVIATPNGIRETEGVSVYAAFEERPEEISGTMMVEYTVLELDNMLLLDKNAVRTDDTADYVMILEDGVAMKRYVVCGPENDEVVCILDGVTAGQQVVLN